MRFRVASIVALGCVALAPTGAAHAGGSSLRTIDEILDAMSRREKAAQLVVAAVPGRTLGTADVALLRDRGLGGIILFSHNYRDPTQLRRLTRAIQAAAEASDQRIGALIAADQEGGVVERFPDLAPDFGPPEVGSLSEAETMGRATGTDLHRVGVNLNLAPVADRDRGPAHLMRDRAFGRQASVVRARVGAYLDGILSTGTAATLKHFPGIGAAPGNTDDERVVIRLSRDDLSIEEQPFLAARDRSRAIVMVSNAIYPAYEPGVPAGVSPRMLRHLHARIAPEIVVITDDLVRIAWRFEGRTRRACARAIAAGADLALISLERSGAGACIDAIVDAAATGAIARARLDEAVTRVLRLKRALGLLP